MGMSVLHGPLLSLESHFLTIWHHQRCASNVFGSCPNWLQFKACHWPCSMKCYSIWLCNTNKCCASCFFKPVKINRRHFRTTIHGGYKPVVRLFHRCSNYASCNSVCVSGIICHHIGKCIHSDQFVLHRKVQDFQQNKHTGSLYFVFPVMCHNMVCTALWPERAVYRVHNNMYPEDPSFVITPAVCR